MPNAVKKNVEINLSGNIRKELLEIQKTMHELNLRAKHPEATEKQLKNWLSYYDFQIKEEKKLDKIREINFKREKVRVEQRKALLEKVSSYKGGNSIVGKTMTAWQTSLESRVKDVDEGEDYSKSLISEVKKFEKVSGVVGGIATAFNALNIVLSPVIKGLHNLEKQITANVEALINMKNGLATYGGSTLITNAEARNVRLQWGLSASQYAGFRQASNLLNVNTEEDLYYMNADQRSLFLNYMQKYAKYYDKLESSGVLRNIQELQLEFEEFKTEMSYEFLTWVADNRDLITGSLEVIMESVRAIGEFTKGIFNWLRTNNPGVFTPNQLYNNTFTSNSDSGIVGSLDLAALQEAGFVVNS